MPPETTHAERRVHILGAGPVGLMLTALLQTTGTFSIHLYEKRREYTRTRMVKLDSYLVADSVENYCIDHIDGENLEAVFDRTELDEGLAFRRSIPSDLKALLRNWTLGFCPIRGKAKTISTGWDWSPKMAIASASASAMRLTMKNMGVGFWPGCRVIWA
jgi:hypothetical protein